MRKKQYFCNNLLLYTIMVLKFIINKFSCILKKMSRNNIPEPQPDSASYSWPGGKSRSTIDRKRRFVCKYIFAGLTNPIQDADKYCVLQNALELGDHNVWDHSSIHGRGGEGKRGGGDGSTNPQGDLTKGGAGIGPAI